MTSSLSKNLVGYAALAASFGAVADANGQVVYVDIEPDFEASNGMFESFELDFDENGINDLILTGNPLGNRFNGIGAEGFVFYYFSSLAYLIKLPLESIVGTNPSSYYLGFVDGIIPMRNLYGPSSCASYAGDWCEAKDEYAGFRFIIDDEYRYGWIRITMLGYDWIVKDYAYTDEPGLGIKAGTLETVPLSVVDQSLQSIIVSSNNKQLEVSGLESKTIYILYSITGQKIISGSIDVQNNSIDASGKPKGLYILELKDEVTGHVIRKKVVI